MLNIRSVFGIGASAAVMLATTGCNSTVGTGPDSDVVQQRVDAGGYQVEMERWAGSRPTVVFLSGLGEPMSTWKTVPRLVNKFAGVVRYDRGGVAASADAPDARTSRDVADELRRSLQAAGVPGPYVLVGHSIGGLHMHQFAQRYPALVRGLVFVDATPAETILPLRDVPLPPGSTIEDLLAQGADAQGLTRGARKEFLSQLVSAQQVAENGRLPDVPVYVLTSMKVQAGESASDKQAWFAAHQAWVRQVSRATHVGTTRSGHHIHWDEPQLVADAIKTVIETSR